VNFADVLLRGRFDVEVGALVFCVHDDLGRLYTGLRRLRQVLVHIFQR
jgi:hypothetical protein